MQIITNNEKHNHMGKLVQMSAQANMMIIVSAFISGNLGKMFDSMPTIKQVTIYTNLSGYDDGADKIIALFDFCNYCKKKGIDLLIKSDDDLHGKAYLFYRNVKDKMIEPKGFVISSGNFTENGMRNNHEFGVMINDEMQQNELASMINNLKTYEITEQQLAILVEKAREYKKKFESISSMPKFDVDEYVNLKPSKQNKKETRYFLKPLGTADRPFEKGRTLKERDQIGFGDEIKSIHKRDVFLCHATGPQMIVGYYMVSSDKQYWRQSDENDRWPYKFNVVCKSIPFSKKWWNYGLKTKELAEKFLAENPGEHITKKGGDSIGSLNFGSERIELTEAFARYIIERIPEVEE